MLFLGKFKEETIVYNLNGAVPKTYIKDEVLILENDEDHYYKIFGTDDVIPKHLIDTNISQDLSNYGFIFGILKEVC